MIVTFRADQSMLAHLKRQGNRSAYLRSLVRADMEGERIAFNIEAVVERIIAERFAGLKQPEKKEVDRAASLAKSILEM